MSKLSFRARALDAAKPLPVYRSRDVPDLTDCVSINRAVPQMPTGMEKEEELEHHLQRAISAQQVFRDKKENMVIPVPEADSHTTYYERLYRGEVRVPKQLIHIQPLGLDPEQPDYDLDSEDETLLNRLNRKMEIRPLQFETMVDRLEKASTQQPVPLAEAKLLLNEDDFLLRSVYDYWLRKRRSFGASLLPAVKQEKRDGSTNGDAYVAFRRRTEKMQTRKNRKNDEASYERMLRLRREFSRTVTILEMIKRREKSKRELLHLTLEVMERRYQMGDFSGDTLREVSLPLVEKPAYCAPTSLTGSRHKSDARTKMKKQMSIRDELPFPRRDRLADPPRRPGRPAAPFSVNMADIKQYDFHSSGDEDSPAPPPSPLSSGDEDSSGEGAFVFRRTDGCQYVSPCAEQTGGVDLPDLPPPYMRYYLAELAPHWTGLSRRRIGRGGRMILDRASCAVDPALKDLDSVTQAVCRTRTSLLSGPAPEQRPSLTQVLKNLQTLRRLCYRPRAPQDRHPTWTPLDGSTPGRCGSLDHTCGPRGVTEEQYQSHQQQLVQMQKQQLEQQSSAGPDPRSRQHRMQVNTSKTLDSASAQFAASAVISAPPPPRSHVNGESKPYKMSVNGVRPPPRSLQASVLVVCQQVRAFSTGATPTSLPLPSVPPQPQEPGGGRLPRPPPRCSHLSSPDVCLKARRRCRQP
ncbi:enhancer of polycomb homolog 2 isoform X2 [Antennarius striatus]|uniref:enhancer of polycomb homolog 2 isoform X2 n=1 Tax=Antennarius striatus TaxID=241820 RepID=UPI0035AEDFD9